MKVGIVGYGAYVPRLRIKVEEIAHVWNKDPETIKNGLVISEKSVPEADEDTVIIAVQAAKNAFKRAGIEPKKIGSVFIGSESHPYAVKPSGSVVIDALGIGPSVTTVDTEFACRAGTTSMFLCAALVKAGFIEFGLGIGADTAQGKPGDALEYTAAAGGAAFIMGKEKLLAEMVDYYSFVTDTPDFFRREGEAYPSHGGRFTGKPAYFKHVLSSTKKVMEKNNMKPEEFDHAIFHMPNGKFPRRAAKKLGFSKEQIANSLVVDKIGNTYSGSSPLGLTSVLDVAGPNQKILLTSYGSGAGSDSFIFKTTKLLKEKQEKARKTSYYIDHPKKEYISYGVYAKLRNKLRR